MKDKRPFDPHIISIEQLVKITNYSKKDVKTYR